MKRRLGAWLVSIGRRFDPELAAEDCLVIAESYESCPLWIAHTQRGKP